MNCEEVFAFLFCLFRNPFCVNNHLSNESLMYSLTESDSDDDLIGLYIN